VRVGKAVYPDKGETFVSEMCVNILQLVIILWL